MVGRGKCHPHGLSCFEVLESQNYKTYHSRNTGRPARSVTPHGDCLLASPHFPNGFVHLGIPFSRLLVASKNRPCSLCAGCQGKGQGRLSLMDVYTGKEAPISLALAEAGQEELGHSRGSLDRYSSHIDSSFFAYIYTVQPDKRSHVQDGSFLHH